MSGNGAGKTTGRWTWANKASEASSFATPAKLELNDMPDPEASSFATPAKLELNDMPDPEADMNALHLLSSENDDVELLEHALRQGRLNNSSSNFRMSGICSRFKLRQGLPATPPPSSATAMEENFSVMSGRKFGAGYGWQDLVNGRASTPAEGGTAPAGGLKPRYVYALFVMGVVALVGVSLFIVNDGLVMVEVASKAHSLAGLKPWYPDPDDEVMPQLHSEFSLRESRQEQRQGGSFESNARSNEGRRTYPQDPARLQGDGASSGALSSSATFSALPRSNSPVNIPIASSEKPPTPWNPTQFPATVPFDRPFDRHDVKHLAHQIEHRPQCLQGPPTHWAQLFGLPPPDEDDVIRLTAGSVYRLQLKSVDIAGRRRCAGRDYYETDLRSPIWRSRPFVNDLGDGSYEMELQVHPRFAGRFFFGVILVCSNFKCLKRTTPNLTTGRLASRYSINKLVADLDLEFVLPAVKTTELQISSVNLTDVKAAINEDDDLAARSMNSRSGFERVEFPELKDCKAADFTDRRRWNGRWTRNLTTFNPNCNSDSEGEANRLECFKVQQGLANCLKDSDATCFHGAAMLSAVGWKYSAHCNVQIFTKDEAWQCLNGRWILWWSDDDDEQEIALLRALLKSVLGLELSEGLSDASRGHRSTNNVYTRPDGDGNRDGNASSGPRRQQRVRISTLWNVDLETKLDDFRPVFDSYFTRSSSPDIVIMMASGPFRDAPDRLWRNWTDFMEVGPRQTTEFWKGTFDSMESVERSPRVVFASTAGVRHLADVNVQLVEMHDRFLLENFLRANLTSDFRIVDVFDLMYSFMRRYDDHGNRQQLFVDLMTVHMLLNAICSN